MFGADPIDLFDPAPYLGLFYYGHILLGLVALSAILIAFFTRKGSPIHKLAGRVFFVSLAIVCISSIGMLIVNFIPPLLVATVASFSAVCSAILALRQTTKKVIQLEYISSAVLLIALIVFLVIGFTEAAQGTIPFFGPIIIAIIPVFLLFNDAKWFRNQSKRTELRIARHLHHMIWAVVITIRAPLVEIAATGVPIPPPVIIIGPIVAGIVGIWWAKKRFRNLISSPH